MQESRHPESLRSVLLLGAFSLSLVLTQSGCPQGADLESPAAWNDRIGSGGSNTGSGGGNAGTGVSGPVLDFSTIQCPGTTPQDFLKGCTKPYCHGDKFVGELDLRPDSGFAQRTLDVDAPFASIYCKGAPNDECIPLSCPPAGSVKFIDSNDPTASWILTKVHGGQSDCGGPMPDAKGLTADAETCLTEIVNATAALK